jgi:hypothetical protein
MTISHASSSISMLARARHQGSTSRQGPSLGDSQTPARPQSRWPGGWLGGLGPEEPLCAVAQERRLIARHRDPHDARRTLVELTGAGTATRERLDRILGDVQDEVSAPLGTAERRTLLRLLEPLS